MPAKDDPQAAALPLTGQCYCGESRVAATALPQTVTYCHCSDCKRVTGSPLPAFAGFAPEQVTLTPNHAPVSHATGVARWFCPDCGSPLLASFDYLPDQVYVPLGIMDDLDALAPQMHCHTGSKANWLHLSDDLPRQTASGRDQLRGNAP